MYQANSISLLANGGGGEGEDSDESFIGGPYLYLDSENEELNMLCLNEEVNMFDQWEEDEEDSIPDQEEYEDCGTKEDEDGEGMDEKTFTHQKILQRPIEGLTFISKDSMFAFYREHIKLKEFGVVKKPSVKKSGDTVNYVVFACDKGRKEKQKKRSKMVDCKALLNVVLMHDGSRRVINVVGEHNHALNARLSRFMSSHREVSMLNVYIYF
ncbi:hypothetical protein RND71_008159 [Anisodus tanguticus]|uniref:FAR1 domain-containing protein n=1 Tax=Anisodus tanguticus TaxID=243964 RepID=A0AAE1VU27_9SOLA|nr:hypothetical protein RND71_008159 [Anisodus tanguticus]